MTAPSQSAENTQDINPWSKIDAHDSALYFNRELTWLKFNQRVLHEAVDTTNPLLERLKFLAIFASNLDEFFMKRIGGLVLQQKTGVAELTVDGRTPAQQLEETQREVRKLKQERDGVLRQVLDLLPENGIHILEYENLSTQERDHLRNYYIDNIFPLITPQVFDPAHPFPFISNLSLNILVTISQGEGKEDALARIKVPLGSGNPRFIRLDNESYRYVPVEQIIANNLDLLFPGAYDIHYDFFSVARNAAAEKEESGASDLMEMIESELRDRRFAPIVRIVVSDTIEPKRLTLLSSLLGLAGDTDVFTTPSYLLQRNLMEIATLPITELRDPPHRPINHHLLVDTQHSIFHIIREAESILVQHPFESFATSVVRFLEEATKDPKVRAIKMTLYRTNEKTRIVDLLIEAARNGKQVAVVVELKAKFDEKANITWAGRMEESGVHVTYGVVGLKTHCKVILVVRQDYTGLNRYVHIGTGNYHGDTAKLYTDLGLLTCDKDIGQDVTELFNYLTTGFASRRKYNRILPAPKLLKKRILEKIHREIEVHDKQSPGLIQIKTNALEDSDVVFALYKASQAGVKVELIVRDSCRLKPGIAGLSDNISVISIVGRFLEHSRIFYFRNGGDEEYYIGSADLMKRNLEHRVEVVTPICKKELQQELRLLLNTMLEDNVDAWDMQSNGEYIKRQPEAGGTLSSQQQQIKFASSRQKTKKYQKILKQQAQINRDHHNKIEQP